MNVIYASMWGTSQKITLPVTLDMEQKGCALFEITGKVSPHTEKPLFLCADFLESSIMGAHRQLPVLRRITLIPEKEGQRGASIEQIFNKMLWLPTNRSPVKEIRLYICDERGNPAPFNECSVSCTLVCIPNIHKL